MTEAASTARPGMSIGSRLPWIVAATAVGMSVGLLSDIIWPNPVYGYQLIIGGLAVLIGLGAVVVAFALPGLRGLAVVAIGAAIGVIAGISLGFSARPSASPALIGSVEVDLGSPVAVQVKSTQAICDVQDGHLAYLETPSSEGLELGDGRRLSVVLTSPLGIGGAAAPEPPDGSGAVPAFDITVHWTLPDGSPTETVMTYGPGTQASASGTFSSGSLAFGGLIVSPLSEQRDPIDLRGTLRWECPAQ